MPVDLLVLTRHRPLAALLSSTSLLFSHLLHMVVRQTEIALSQLTCQQGLMVVGYSHGAEGLWSCSEPPLLYGGPLHLCSTSSAGRT